MEVIPLSIPDVKLLIPKKFGDHRGYFVETYNVDACAKSGIESRFVQDNQSMSAQKNTVRALHYQVGDLAQAKLIRVLKGSILDVAVDVRRSSPTFGQHVHAILSAENGKQAYVPVGFAHGFITLEPNTEVFYKVTAFYSPKHERGIIWNDPALNIDWGIPTGDAVLSDRDTRHPMLAEQKDLFE